MRAILIALLIIFFEQANAYLLPQHPIKSYDCEICDTLSHESLQDNWKIEPIILNKAGSNIQKSNSYVKRVTAKQLARGIILPLQAPGAVLRITSLQNKTPLPSLQLRSGSSQFMNLKEASSLYSKDDAIDDSLRVDSSQTMLQIRPELGIGNFILKSEKMRFEDRANEYLINVFEKYSLIYLQIEPSALQYQYGDEFNATITLTDNLITYSTEDIKANLIGPKNQTIPLKIKELKRNQFLTNAFLYSEKNTHGENWYIEVEVQSDQEDGSHVYRTGQAAFSYSIPSASLISIEKISSTPLTLAATVDVATASRYALQSVLYKKNNQGVNVPIETVQSGQWLTSGKQIIKFTFDNSTHLAEDQLSVGYLHLTDYGQLKTIYQYDLPIKLSQL